MNDKRTDIEIYFKDGSKVVFVDCEDYEEDPTICSDNWVFISWEEGDYERVNKINRFQMKYARIRKYPKDYLDRKDREEREALESMIVNQQ